MSGSPSCSGLTRPRIRFTVPLSTQEPPRGYPRRPPGDGILGDIDQHLGCATKLEETIQPVVLAYPAALVSKTDPWSPVRDVLNEVTCLQVREHGLKPLTEDAPQLMLGLGSAEKQSENLLHGLHVFVRTSEDAPQ
jgi:hypothetical protein